MATKIYTAQEMREIANALSGDNEDLEDLVIADADYGLHINHNKTFEVASMLHQAADAMEREDKYEYAVKYFDSCEKREVVDDLHHTTPTAAKHFFPLFREAKCVVRRSIGDWEEVKE